MDILHPQKLVSERQDQRWKLIERCLLKEEAISLSTTSGIILPFSYYFRMFIHFIGDEPVQQFNPRYHSASLYSLYINYNLKRGFARLSFLIQIQRCKKEWLNFQRFWQQFLLDLCFSAAGFLRRGHCYLYTSKYIGAVKGESVTAMVSCTCYLGLV